MATRASNSASSRETTASVFLPGLFSSPQQQQPIFSSWLEKLEAELGATLLQRQHRQEIEGAIARAKRPLLDRWIRGQSCRAKWKQDRRDLSKSDHRHSVSGARILDETEDSLYENDVTVASGNREGVPAQLRRLESASCLFEDASTAILLSQLGV